MKRYLITYSYIGTNFRTGVQKQMCNGVAIEPETSVQGLLELAFKRFKPVNDPCIVLSSRTDQGVHALKTTAHIDLQKEGKESTPFHPDWLMHGLNRTFDKNHSSIRVQGIDVVPDEFHARFCAKARTYLYRFAVRKRLESNLPADGPHGFSSPIPMSEWKRCYFIQRQDFNEALLSEVIELFIGTHDFRTFMGHPGSQPKDKDTLKTIINLEIKPGKPLLPTEYEPIANHYNYWEVVCKGRSFLYRQVRRIVAVLIAVAQGRLNVNEVRRMIEAPSPDSWSSAAVVPPAFGLYLVDVEYDPADLIIPVKDAGKISALLEERKKRLKPSQTKVTLSNGEVYIETRTSEGNTEVERVKGEISPGFIVDEKPDLQVGVILPRLLLGSQDVAADSNLLKKFCITHVLSIGVSVQPPVSDINHHYLELLDLPESDIFPVLEQACDFIHSVVTKSFGTVFVHCNAGVSRAPTIVMAYLIKYHNMTLFEAMELVKSCRPCVKPNSGFFDQLSKYYDYVKNNS